MDIRYAIHPDHMKLSDNDGIRKHFLIEGLFEKDKMNMVYSHIDRIIAGGVCPTETEPKLTGTKELGADTFLERREMGIINIGSTGSVFVEGKEYVLEKRECLFIGMGSKEVAFKSADRRFFPRAGPSTLELGPTITPLSGGWPGKTRHLRTWIKFQCWN